MDTELAGGFSFLESPRWHQAELYLSDFYTHRVLRMSVDGEFHVVCEVPGQPSGLGFDRQGRLLIVSMIDRRLLRLQSSGHLSEVADLSALAPYHCNDMIVDGCGRAYIGNFGSDVDIAGVVPTCLIMVEPDGTLHDVATDLVVPNGMAITADGATLLVAETFAHRISAFCIADDGTLHSRRTWASFGPADAQAPTTISEVLESGRPTPDGICLDADGSLWMASATGAGAMLLASDGTPVDFIDTSPYAVYAVALGGSDGRTLFMCAAPPLGMWNAASEFDSALLCRKVKVPAIWVTDDSGAKQRRRPCHRIEGPANSAFAWP